MERYNLPSSGIEVIINKGQIQAQNPDPYLRPQHKEATRTNKAKPNQRKTDANHTEQKKPFKYFATRSLFIVASVAALGNVPFAASKPEISHEPTRALLSNADILNGEATEQLLSSSTNTDKLLTVAAKDEKEPVFTGITETPKETLPAAPAVIKTAITEKPSITEAEHSLSKEELELEAPKPSAAPTPALTLAKAETTPLPVKKAKPKKTAKPSKSGRWRIAKQTKTESLKSFLSRKNFSKSYKALSSNKSIASNLRRLKKGRYVITRSKGSKLNQLLYVQSSKKAYVVTRYGTEYKGKWESGKFAYRDHKQSFKIRSNIIRSAKNVGIPSRIASRISKVVKQDINLRRLQRGDLVNVVYESFRYGNQTIDSRNLLATELRHRGKRYRRIRYTLRGKTQYLNPNRSMRAKRTSFDRRPVRVGRISSHYGFRRHPVSGRRKLHKGLDIAAPRGTPIYATGNGRIKFAGRQRGYGKVVEIKHAGGISTLYAHMSRIRSGMRNGKSVKRGQIIGYVGSTGTSTGNHVHYEYRVNGRPRNPYRVSLPKTGIFSTKEIRAFKRFANRMIRKLAQADSNSRTAQAGNPASDG